MFGIESCNKVIFNRNFLKSVAFNVAFNENKLLSDRKQTFIDSFKNDYPVVNNNVPISVIQSGTTLTLKDNNQLFLRSENSKKEFILQDTSLQYTEYGDVYKSSNNFNNQIKKSLNFLTTNNTSKYKSLSLEKVNLIAFSNKPNINNKLFSFGAISDILSTKLLCNYSDIKFKSIDNHIKQNIYTLNLEDENYLLTIQYGYIIIERDETAPKSTIKGQLVLDLNIEKNLSGNINDIDSELVKCHQEIYNAFRWCISAKMLNLLQANEN